MAAALPDQPFLNNATIEHIARGMLDCTLSKHESTHSAHFAAALWLLREGHVQPFEGSTAPMIRAYNQATGTSNTATNGYHETITLASLQGAAAALALAGGAPLRQVLATLLAGPLGHSRWPLEYWSQDVLMSVDARQSWVAPDLEPLPW